MIISFQIWQHFILKLGEHGGMMVMAPTVLDLRTLRERLEGWEFEINCRFSQLPFLRIRNDVDNEGPPADFTFITDYQSSCVPLHTDEQPVVGCECSGGCGTESSTLCCPGLADCKFAYNKNGLLSLKPGNPIYECNSRCTCGPECRNRVVQRGQTVRLGIFRTNNGCGWGLKTLDDIKKGQFVLEYIGEIIHKEEVLRREEHFDYDTCSYLFNLDFNDKNSPYTVDATHYGNASRFINHSCSPNLEVFPVWINHLDPDLPRLAIFATQNIKKGEELSFDYKMSKSKVKNNKKKRKRENIDYKGHTPCLCGAKNCRQYLN